ncbi:hypothetical protein T05_5922 [Trichinella murrelli]|uniref:Uncharacterized protein n=1 Tax=Trichinella murrelli TaxID=144512 RepID=A0A0V0U1A2_9BILA|nr:hypothetical protein T05_5922 [Trichinella murrelli]
MDFHFSGEMKNFRNCISGPTPFACRTNWVGKVGNNKRWVVLQAAAGVVSDRSFDPLPAVKNFSFTT